MTPLRHSIPTCLTGALCVFAFIVSSADASAQDVSAGARVGAAYSSLPQPNDPRGEPTLMSGTAFSGLGIGAGLWAGFEAVEFSGTALHIEASAMFNRAAASGFEARGDARREATITTSSVRIPILAVLAMETGESLTRIGLGLEPIIGLSSGATVTIENSDESPEPLFTTPVTHLGLTSMIGYSFGVSDGVRIPLELRVTYDPMVGTSTVDRFQGYESASEPGEYEAAFRWQFLLATGFSFDL